MTESKKFKHIGTEISKDDNIDLVMHYLDDNQVNLFKYI